MSRNIYFRDIQYLYIEKNFSYDVARVIIFLKIIKSFAKISFETNNAKRKLNFRPNFAPLRLNFYTNNEPIIFNFRYINYAMFIEIFSFK